MMESLEVRFDADRATQNTVLFREFVPKGRRERIGRIYIQKDTLEEMGNPDSILLWIAPATDDN